MTKNFFRVKADSGLIFEFFSINPDVVENLNEDGEVIAPEDSVHSYWVSYEDYYHEYEEDSVKKAQWNLKINGVNFGNLEDLKLGAIYRKDFPRLLPSVDFGTTNPSWFVFDLEDNEWKSPLFDTNGVKVWDTVQKDYVLLEA
jgi:hypothetical protein